MEKKEKRHLVYWGTPTELKFIKNIGTGRHRCESARVNNKSRKELLEGYLAGAKLRHNWEDIEKEKVIEFTKECIRHA